MFTIYETGRFRKRIKKELSLEQQRQLRIVLDRVAENAWIGDALGPRCLREVKLQSKRVYYIVDSFAVLLVTVSDKDEQQHHIDAIRERLSELLKELRILSGRA